MNDVITPRHGHGEARRTATCVRSRESRRESLSRSSPSVADVPTCESEHDDERRVRVEICKNRQAQAFTSSYSSRYYHSADLGAPPTTNRRLALRPNGATDELVHRCNRRRRCHRRLRRCSRRRRRRFRGSQCSARCPRLDYSTGALFIV